MVESEHLIQKDKQFNSIKVISDVDANSKHGLRETHIGIVFRIATFVVEIIKIISSQSCQIQQIDTEIDKLILNTVFYFIFESTDKFII